MSQPDTAQVVREAADAVMNRTPHSKDIQQMFQGAAWALKDAEAAGDIDYLRLVILIRAGEFAEAAAVLMNLALSGTATQAANANDPLAGVFSGRPNFGQPTTSNQNGHGQAAPDPDPDPDPAQSANSGAQQQGTGPTTSGRNRRR